MPFNNELHVDQLLSGISVKYQNKEYIGDQMFPTMQVAKESDLYRIFDRNFRLPQTLRANKAKSNQHDFHVSTASYVLSEHALKEYVSDRDAQNYDIADLRMDTVNELTDKIMLRREKSVADLFVATNWSLGVSLSTAQQFSLDTTTSSPVPIYDTGASVVLANSGHRVNYGQITQGQLTALKNHGQVLDRIKYTQVLFGEDLLASLFGLEKMHVARAQIDTANEGATSVIGDVWGDVSFIGYKPNTPSPLAPSAGYIFQSKAPMVKRWRDEERSSEAIEVGTMYQAKIVSSLSGYLINDCLA